MKRTTITLPESLNHKLHLEARRRRVPVTEVVREALQDRLDTDRRPLDLIGIGASGRTGIAQNFDRLRDKARPKDLGSKETKRDSETGAKR